MAEKLDEIIDQASRLMAAGWRGNPHMSGDDRNFMSPSMRMRHDEKARAVVEFVLQALRPGSTGETEGWVLVPKEPTEEMVEAMREASRKISRGGISGMTIEAQFRAEHRPEYVAYSAMLAAAGGRDE